MRRDALGNQFWNRLLVVPIHTNKNDFQETSPSLFIKFSVRAILRPYRTLVICLIDGSSQRFPKFNMFREEEGALQNIFYSADRP